MYEPRGLVNCSNPLKCSVSKMAGCFFARISIDNSFSSIMILSTLPFNLFIDTVDGLAHAREPMEEPVLVLELAQEALWLRLLLFGWQH